MFRTEWLRYVADKKIYIHNENDPGGIIFRNKICEIVYKRNNSQEVYEFTCSSLGEKDPSDLFKKCVGTYENVINVNKYSSYRSKIKQLLDEAIKLDLEDIMLVAQEPIPNMPRGAQRIGIIDKEPGAHTRLRIIGYEHQKACSAHYDTTYQKDPAQSRSPHEHAGKQ